MDTLKAMFSLHLFDNPVTIPVYGLFFSRLRCLMILILSLNMLAYILLCVSSVMQIDMVFCKLYQVE